MNATIQNAGPSMGGHFKCVTCDFVDSSGQMWNCPICEPEKNRVVNPPCFFLRVSGSGCRLDGGLCPHVQMFSFDSCKKLHATFEM